MELSRKINDKATTELSNFLEIGTSHIINVKTPLDLSFVFELQNYLRDRSELFYEKRTPRDTPELSLKESILDQVEKKDVLLSYPFESMKPFIKMLNDAAEDPDVVSIKMTLYLSLIHISQPLLRQLVSQKTPEEPHLHIVCLIFREQSCFCFWLSRMRR